MAAEALDHLVINTRFDTTAAAALFSALGFTLTPRGHHAFGSVNHLIVFEDDYLELIGLPEQGTVLRQEILDNPKGIDGLVFKTQDADSVHTWLSESGAALQPLHAFSRPVQIDGQTFDAAFRTVRFEPGAFAAGRVYFCQHLTPELIWRRVWQRHANKARRLTGLVVVSSDPAVDAARYAEVAQGTAVRDARGAYRIHGKAYTIVVRSQEDYAQIYGELACDPLDRASFFGSIGISIHDSSVLHAALALLSEQVRYRIGAARTSVYLPEFNSLLDFFHGDDSL